MKTMAMLTGGGMGGARELAEMIRRLGRGRDTILAHITPEEADLLRKLGGSGKTNPQTGLPEFQEEFDLDAGGDFTPDYTPDYSGFSEFDFDAGGDYTPQFEAAIEPASQAQPLTDYSDLPQISPVDVLDRETGQQLMREPGALERIEDVLGRAKKTADKYPTLTRLGVGGASALGQALMARRARGEAEGMAARERTAAAPFRAAAQEALARASAGGMTPQEQRAFEAAQARATQGLSQRNMAQGSAAAGILAGQKARATSQAVAKAMSEAMRYAGIADQYEGRALQLQLSSDKALSDILGEVLAREATAATRQQVPASR